MNESDKKSTTAYDLETACTALTSMIPQGWSIQIHIYCDRPVASVVSPYGDKRRLAGSSLSSQIENAFDIMPLKDDQ